MVVENLAMFGCGEERIVKLEVEWKWNKEKEKKHYRLFLTNEDEFEDITLKPFQKPSKDIDHDFIQLETNIKRFLNELGTTRYELEEGYEMWTMTDDANELRTLLSQSEEKIRKFGLEENTGIECCSVSDVKKWYKDCPNKVAFKIYFKKSIDLHYEFYCKHSHNGFFIDYTPDAGEICVNNIWKMRKWLEELK